MGVKNVVLHAGEITKIDPHYDMTLDQAISIKRFYGGNLDSIVSAFNFGYLQGMTATNSASTNEGKESSNQSSLSETIIKKINAADDVKLRNLSLFIDVFLEDKKAAKSI
ncbi:hypothetical protein AALB39_26165 [Lachnospiraceae bacterium 54-53]